MSPLRRLSAGLAAGLALTVLLAGPPLVLVAAVGNPLPQAHALAAGQLDDSTILHLLACLAWIAWAQFAAGTVLEAGAAARGRTLPRRIALGQGVARTLITIIATSLALAPLAASAVPTAHAASPRLGTPRHAASTTALLAGPPAPTTATVAATSRQDQRPAAANADPIPPGTRTITVGADPTIASTLWSIAQHTLGNPMRWQEIWDLNRDRVMTDGRTFTDPDTLHDGWVLYLPGQTTSTSTTGSPATGGGPATATPVDRSHVDTVRPGDTLSSIAAAEYGDPNDYPTIAAANQNRAEPNGRTLTDPNLILPGWTLTIPASPESRQPPPIQAGPPTQTPPRTEPSPQTPPNGTDPAPTSPSGQPSTSDAPATPTTTSAPAATSSVPTTPPGSDTPASTLPAGNSTGSSLAPRSPSPTGTPAPNQAASSTDGARTATDEPHSSTAPGTEVPVFAWAGAGTLLAALSLAELTRRRRRQQRQRRPGRATPQPSPRLRVLDKALIGGNDLAEDDTAFLTHALRGLVHTLASSPGAQLPDVLAARLSDDHLELRLASEDPNRPDTPAPTPPPGPWHLSADSHGWQLDRNHVEPLDAAETVYHYAPYPALAGIGTGPDGARWLLDIERTATITLTGPPHTRQAWLRYLIAELAHNQWSEHLHVTAYGVAAEMSSLNPTRLTHTTDLAELITTMQAQLSDLDQSSPAPIDVLAGRLHSIDADAYTPEIIVVDTDNPDELQSVTELAATLTRRGGRLPLTLILATTTTSTSPSSDGAGGIALPATRGQITITSDATLTVPDLDLSLSAYQVPVEEAADLSALLTLAATAGDEPMPAARGDRPWDAYVDAAGALRPESIRGSTERHTASAPDGQPDTADQAMPVGQSMPGDQTTPASETSQTDDASQTGQSEVGVLFPLPDDVVLDRTASTLTDLARLAPPLSGTTRNGLQHADPDLDADLANWHNPESGTPKLHLLGPLTLTGVDEPPESRGALLTELIAYLLTRPRGATVEELAAALWPHIPDAAVKTTPRQAISLARQWLRVSSRTGRLRLPRASTDAAGAKRYRISDVLVDADLFRRLRLRGMARGADGIEDLRAALALVTGPPFSERRRGGYSWLADVPLQHEYTAMIVDTAHLLATLELAAGNPAAAAAAAHTSLRADAADDTALLDLLAAAKQLEHHAEADTYLRRILSNHDAEVEEDLPPRTYEVLMRRGWLPD